MFVNVLNGSYDHVCLEGKTMHCWYSECVDDVFLPAVPPNYLDRYGMVMKLKSCEVIMSSRNNPTCIGN